MEWVSEGLMRFWQWALYFAGATEVGFKLMEWSGVQGAKGSAIGAALCIAVAQLYGVARDLRKPVSR